MKGDEDLQQDFEDGVVYGKQLIGRFLRPEVADPGLPYADVLVVTCGTLFVASLVLLEGWPRPDWLVPIQIPGFLGTRGLPFVPPALAHASQLCACWLLGALSAEAFAADAFTSTFLEAIRRTWRAGAFATGLLLFSTQISTYFMLSSEGLDPYLGASAEADLRLVGIANSVIVDVAVQAVGLTAFRIFRWWDAVGRRQ